MGFRVSWIARRGSSTSELLAAVGASATGEREEFPDVGWYLVHLESEARGAWTLLLADGSDNFGELDDSIAQSLSMGGAHTLFFWCSDTTMSTQLFAFHNGTLAWSIGHDAEEGGLALEGALPPEAEAIVSEHTRAQQEADAAEEGVDHLYEVTADLGRALTGFRHDVDPEGVADEAPFEVLARG